jgi:hypothetical protein
MLRTRAPGFVPFLAAALLTTACRSRSENASAAVLASPAPGTVSPGKESAGKEQYFPLQSYRVGPYAAGGSGFFGGFIDYMQLVNIRDGGVNGIKLTWSECETEYVVERGVECYERLKGGLNGAPAAAMNPLSVGIAYALIDKATTDKIPLITINHGRTDSTDGRVFPYVFPLSLNPYSEISAIVNYIGQRSGSTTCGARRSRFSITAPLMARRPSRSSNSSRRNTDSRPLTSRCPTLAPSKSRSGCRSRSSPLTGSSCAGGES